jgi:hypothetical protein
LLFEFFDTDIAGLLARFPEFAEGMDCRVTCVDSSMDVRDDVRDQIQGLAHDDFGRFIVLAGRDLLGCAPALFSGFDEVYFFTDDKWRLADPFRWSEQFTSDRANFGVSVPEYLRSLLEWSGAVRYLSDGCGLNIACETKEILAAVDSALSSRG